MKLNYWQQCADIEKEKLLTRPVAAISGQINTSVSNIIEQISNGGDKALKKLTLQYDKVSLNKLKVEGNEITAASSRLGDEIKQAMLVAAKNISCFHQAQKMTPIDIETQPGIYCQLVTRPIKSVGLYIPGGSAPLLSTVLMLGIPAKIAECSQIILCSPPPIADEILYAASLCGITEIYQIGGAQAIAAMALGTESIPKVDKIFGPGNAYVTEAKRQISQLSNGAAIDMPAGPSEVLVIADSHAEPSFIAADLLSQAEHGPDSQVILLTPDETLANNVVTEIDKQLKQLSRSAIAEQALKESRIIITETLQQCVEISNRYGPEHLIIQTKEPDLIVPQIESAGSIFLGKWSPESVGDYASGTNHVLPTYGYTSTHSSLGLADFQKRMTIQRLTAKGLLQIAKTVETLAQAEQLTAHKHAVSIRIAKLNQLNGDYHD